MQASSEKELLASFNQNFEKLTAEIGKIIVGQEDVVKNVLISIFSKGHCLLVGVPGLAKTLLVNTIADALGLTNNRIQFTPDLMPSDIIGAEILDESRHFKFIPGPLFSNIILADEINRTPPKTQAALLEAMQEHAVTAAGKRYPLPIPFFVLATQNPIEQEGTYPLPEAQLDRFMFNVKLDYPNFRDEMAIVKRTTGDTSVQVNKVLTTEQILAYQNLVRRIQVADNVVEHAVQLVRRTRPNSAEATSEVNNYISWGAGPRASQYLTVAAKCHSLTMGKFSPDKEDVNAIAESVLRHRVMLNYKAEAEGITIESIIGNLIRL